MDPTVVSRPHDKANRPDHEGANGLRMLLSRQGKTIAIFVVSLGTLIFNILRPSSSQVPVVVASNVTAPPANLHVLIPASRPDVNLCKVLLSAAILGYPSPTIINWNRTFDDAGLVEGGSHLAKISGVHDYVSSLSEGHEDDLVLMVDGYDVWLQLRPQTLVDRYFDINRRADERIRKELGTAALVHQIHQEIIFGCQKRCWPWHSDDPPCYAVPESTLPRNIYGSRTDTEGEEDDPFINYRQRFLNSGVAVGSVRAMRKLFKQALEQAQYESNFGSDQYIFSHIFGDQEIWREVMRRDSMHAAARLGSKLKGHPKDHFNLQHLDEVREKAANHPDRNFEFGIGVDSGSEIGLNTVFAEDDTEWVHYSDSNQLQKVQDDRKIHPRHRRLKELPPDISASLPPFWTFSAEELPRWTAWSDVPLLTNVWTGITPVVIHHNAHRRGLKSRRESWWPSIWFHKHARTLLDAHIYSPIVPVATGGYDEKSIREWWPYEIWKGGARNGRAALGSMGKGWLRFDRICCHDHEELFRDGKGSWELPENH